MSQLGERDVGPKRIALLHVAKKQLGLDDASYRDILRLWGGVESSKELDGVGFECVMIRMGQLGFKSTWIKRTFGDRHESMASPAQVNLIRLLWERYDSNDASEAHLNTWLSKFHHVAALRFVSADKAAKIIPALKAMAARPRG